MIDTISIVMVIIVFCIGLMFGWSAAINRYYFGGLEGACEPPAAFFASHCKDKTDDQ